MKPSTSIAMQTLIAEVRSIMPFDATEDELCTDSCQGCSVKLLTFIETELEAWEEKLQQGVKPDLNDLNQLGKSCRKVYMILKKNKLLNETPCEDSHG